MLARTECLQLTFIDVATLFGILCGLVSTFLAWSYTRAGRKLALLQVRACAPHTVVLPRAALFEGRACILWHCLGGILLDASLRVGEIFFIGSQGPVPDVEILCGKGWAEAGGGHG